MIFSSTSRRPTARPRPSSLPPAALSTRPPLPAANAPVAAKSRALVTIARRLIPIVASFRARAEDGSTERPLRRARLPCHLQKAQLGPPTIDLAISFQL